MSVSDSSILAATNVPLDSSVVTTNAGTVQRERVAIGDANQGGQLAGVNTAGELSVAIDALVDQNEQIIELLKKIHWVLSIGFAPSSGDSDLFRDSSL